MRILLSGGSRSGKSGLAQSLAKKLAGDGPAYYWATMEPTDGEDEARIEKHLRDRDGLGFITVERGRFPLDAELPSDACVLFDSVTALLANAMFAEGFDPNAPETAAKEILSLSLRVKNFVCVSDEIFRDGAGFDETTEAFRRGLAEVCRALAGEFDCVAEVVCGILQLLKGGLPE